jgi:hypothetical protein
MGGATPGGMAQQPKQKPKPKGEPAEDEEPLPEDTAEWVTDHYYQARKEHDPRLVEAVAHLGEQFADTDKADEAAVLLTNLLKKSEEPEPKAGTKRPGGAPMGYPGMGSGMDPSAGMGYSAPEGGAEYDAEYEDEYMEEMASEDMMEEGMGAMPSGYPGMEPGMGPPGYPGAPGRGQASGATVELIRAIVNALGVNGSGTAKTTLTQVVVGTFETDNNRVATLATLETLVAFLCPDYENLLLRCLTSPEELRPLGKAGQTGRPGGMPYGPSSTMPYGDPRSMGYSDPGSMGYSDPISSPYGEEPSGGMYGTYGPSAGGRGGSAPLTAEELQQYAFSLIAPVASEDFRAKIAKHLADPQSPQEDLDLFLPYLRESHPDNVQAQVVLYFAPSMGTETKEVIEDNFLAFSSDAMAGILGVPADFRAEAALRRQSRQERAGRYPGMGPEGYPGMGPDMGVDPSEYEYEMEMEGSQEMMMSEPGAMGPMMRPGAGPRPGRSRTGRPSRYDRNVAGQPGSGRPSRYGGPQAPGQAETAFGPEAFEPADPDLPYRLARQMWSPEMTKLVEDRLARVSSLEKDAPFVLLASTIPVDSTRSTLAQVLQRHWQDGPGALEAAGLFDDVISDPGFLMLVKALPREAPKEAKPARRTLSDMRYRRGGRTPAGRGRMAEGQEGMYPGEMDSSGMRSGMGPEEGGYAPGMGMGPGQGRRAEPQEPDVAWMAASEELVRVFCERLAAAAQATGALGEEGGGLPFALRDDALVTAELQLDWPPAQDTEKEKLSGVPVGQMKLHFVRAEHQSRVSTLESYFKRQLNSDDGLPVHNGAWIDVVRPVPDSEWKRSIDVLLTATVPAGEPFDEKMELPVTVDVLCIDMKVPAAGGEGN